MGGRWIIADVAHSTLTGADLHEPKGVGSAASGTVYTANGAGSGSWASVSTALNFTGMIADFSVPIPPTGWLECDGTAVSRVTYAALFAVNTIQQTGTRTSASAVITGLSSTTHMRAGYFVGGAGITAGATIASVDSASQITLSAAATSSGTSTVIVSPWGLGDGSTTFNIPNVANGGKFRRSRIPGTSSNIGISQSGDNLSHSHTLSVSTSVDGSHSHGGVTALAGADHVHSFNDLVMVSGGITNLGTNSFFSGTGQTTVPNTTGFAASNHSHGITADPGHQHSVNGTSGSSGSESRPINITVMTCIKY